METRYTVDNVLKTLPKINEYEEELDRLCLVSSDYHIKRACAIYNMFSEKGLCRYKDYESLTVDHDSERTLDNNPLELGQKWCDTDWHKNFELSQVKRDENPEQERKILRLDDGEFLNKFSGECKCEVVHQTKEEEMRCSVRDESNASIFAHYIDLVKRGKVLDEVCNITDEHVQTYLANNKKNKDDAKCFEGFKDNVKRFATDSQKFWVQCRAEQTPGAKKTIQRLYTDSGMDDDVTPLGEVRAQVYRDQRIRF